MKATCRKISWPSTMPRATSERPSARPRVVSARRSAIGRPRPSIRSAMLTPGCGPRAEQLARGLVGVGKRAGGLEAGQRHRQLVEEMVGHEAGDLGAVERDQQHIPLARCLPASTSARTAWPDRAPAGARRRGAAAGRRAGRSSAAGGAGGKRRAAAFAARTRPVGVDPHPGHAGRREARRRGGRVGHALDPPQQSARPLRGRDDAPAVGGRLGRDAVGARLAGQPVEAGAGSSAQGSSGPRRGRGGVARDQPAVKVGDEHWLGMALEIARCRCACPGLAAAKARPRA